MEETTTFLDHIVELSAVIISIVALVLSYLANRKLIKQKEKELEKDYKLKETDLLEKIKEYERKEIYKKLNEFYSPLLMLRGTSKALHDTFKNKRNFRTLTKLLEGEEYNGNDQAILNEILLVSEQCKKIILEKSGLIDDDELREIHIPKLLNHFMIIQKAFNKEIVNEAPRFENYVFPNEIDDILLKKVKDLQSRLVELNRVERESFEES